VSASTRDAAARDAPRHDDAEAASACLRALSLSLRMRVDAAPRRLSPTRRHTYFSLMSRLIA